MKCLVTIIGYRYHHDDILHILIDNHREYMPTNKKRLNPQLQVLASELALTLII